MMQTTLRKIRAAEPCGMRLEDAKSVRYLKLRHHLGRGHARRAAAGLTQESEELK